MPRIRASTIVEHKELTRERLFDAALELFTRAGFSGTSITDIAALANVGRTTLYDYFPSKEELLVSLVETRVPPLFSETVRSLPDAGPIDRLEALFRAAFDVIVSHAALAHVLFRVGRQLPRRGRDRMWATLDPVTKEIQRLCEAGVAAGQMNGFCPERLASSVKDVLIGGVEQVLGSADMPTGASEILDERLRFLRSGVCG